MFRSATDIVRVKNKKTQLNTSDNEFYGCEYCSEGGWTSETEVEIHKSILHRAELKEKLNNGQLSVCGICIEEFENDKELLNHIKTDHLYSSKDAYRVEREIFVCDDCCQIFFNKSHLVIHIIQKHTESTRTQRVDCPQCNVQVKHKQIWLHFHKHMAQSVSACRLCFTKFKNRRELKQHLTTHGHHFKCDICGYNSKRSDLFNQHIAQNHKNKIGKIKVRNYKQYFIPNKDVIAGKGQIVMTFKGVYIGNGIRICVLCREICVHQRQMREHIKYDHFTPFVTLKNEYKCTCGLVFSNKVLLRHHIFKEKDGHGVLEEGMM